MVNNILLKSSKMPILTSLKVIELNILVTKN